MGYPYKSLNITKKFIKTIIEELKRKPLNHSIQNIASRCYLVNKKLTFAAYDKIGGGEGFRTIRSRLSFLIQQLRFRSANRGAILIEFAVCMPVLIILLYYVNDLSKLKRYYDQTEFVAQQFVNIIQNISQKRKSKAITRKDIMRAASLAYLTIYPGKTMYRIGTSGSRHELSHAPRLYIYYVKGLAGGKASCSWNVVFICENVSGPVNWGTNVNTDHGDSVESVRFITDATEPSNIYKNLKINEGEEKVIVEVNLFNASHVMNANEYVASDKQETLAKKAFKCLLAAPKPLVKNANGINGWYFDSVVIFTPKPGLFDPDNPPK